MSMSYNSLIANKGSPGSILNWVGYSKIDTTTVLDEAQYLLYETLRVREMRADWTLAMAIGQSSIALPARFLDPIGKIFDVTNVTNYDQINESYILTARCYDSSVSGTLGTNPFTTTINSGVVSVNQTNHGLNQGSTFNSPNAPALNGLTLTGSFNVTSITDANNFKINVGDNDDTLATASGTGGGTGVTYTADNLVAGSPTCWSIWSERIHFDIAMATAWQGKQLYYRRPQLLSAANLTNFLTDRYPKLLRVACLAAAAEYMKDDGEYQKQTSALAALVQNTAIENDLIYRGAIIGTDTPYGR